MPIHIRCEGTGSVDVTIVVGVKSGTQLWKAGSSDVGRAKHIFAIPDAVERLRHQRFQWQGDRYILALLGLVVLVLLANKREPRTGIVRLCELLLTRATVKDLTIRGPSIQALQSEGNEMAF